MSQVTLPSGYRLVEGPPSITDYLALRIKAGLSPVTEAQAAAALPGAWCRYHIVHEPTGVSAAMGGVIGDGGWYFHVVDMAVLPEHQRKGLGNVILTTLMDRIRRDSPPGAYVNLFADPPGRPLYKKHGFVEAAPDEMGMKTLLE